MKKIFILFSLFSTLIYAEGLNFDNLSQTDLDNISKEFSANFVHRPVSPASTLGSIFGFEVGIIAGITDAPKVGAIGQREAPTEKKIDQLAHAGLYGSVSVPFGLTAELVLFPETELGDVTFSHYSAGLKWTFSDTLGIPLVDLAIRGHVGKTEASFSDTVDAVNTTVSLENSTMGIGLLASTDLLIVEPFAGIGYVTRDTDLGATGTARIFDTTFTANQTASSDGSSTQFLVGVQLNLFIMKIAAQYENVFDTSVTSAKLTFGF